MQPPSVRELRRLYLEWTEEQIESYKDSVSRSDLLLLADQVVEELRVTNRGQYQITELLLLEAVDRKISRILKLPTFRAWSRAQGAGDGLTGPAIADGSI